eukprot:CAMPEP_0185844840 /NCGR_PEP_ID=MMETSP1354-20130828/936_1 /TAXON_ID=708628 /ORGANISM="Erythrolobus madagascarensis, Strain CCMP3276" /LENGTH=532 /DNA_ID=CAMNT_0028544629 /DNA_START=463 /DNA_END=2061 /DNA_ORIENTATION=+
MTDDRKEAVCYSESELTNGSVEGCGKANSSDDDDAALDGVIELQDKRIRELESKLRASQAEMEVLKKNLANITEGAKNVATGPSAVCSAFGTPQKSSYTKLAPTEPSSEALMSSKIMMSPVSSSRTRGVSSSPQTRQVCTEARKHNLIPAPAPSGEAAVGTLESDAQQRVNSLVSTTSSGAYVGGMPCSPVASRTSGEEHTTAPAGDNVGRAGGLGKSVNGGNGGGEPSKRGSRRKRAAVEEGLTRYWSRGEHERFLEGVRLYGMKNYNMIGKLVGTRNAQQVRTHAQKFEMRLAREAARSASNGTVPDSRAAAAAAAPLAVAHIGQDNNVKPDGIYTSGGMDSQNGVASGPEGTPPNVIFYPNMGHPRGTKNEQHMVTQTPVAIMPRTGMKSLPPRKKRVRSSRGSSSDRPQGDSAMLGPPALMVPSTDTAGTPVRLSDKCVQFVTETGAAVDPTEHISEEAPSLAGSMSCGSETMVDSASELVFSEVLNDGYPESTASEVPALLPELESEELQVSGTLDTAEFNLWLKQE